MKHLELAVLFLKVVLQEKKIDFTNKEKIDVYTHHPEIFENNPKVNNVIKIDSDSHNVIRNNYEENNTHKTFPF